MYSGLVISDATLRRCTHILRTMLLSGKAFVSTLVLAGAHNQQSTSSSEGCLTVDFSHICNMHTVPHLPTTNTLVYCWIPDLDSQVWWVKSSDGMPTLPSHPALISSQLTSFHRQKKVVQILLILSSIQTAVKLIQKPTIHTRMAHVSVLGLGAWEQGYSYTITVTETASPLPFTHVYLSSKP